MRLIDLSIDNCTWGDRECEATFKCSEEEFRALWNNKLEDPAIYEYRLLGNKILPKTTKQANNDTKVIFNNPATILFINGKKYVSKVHEEEFDEEKGLLMCLAKANGISHLELQRMIKGAKRVSPFKQIAKNINKATKKMQLIASGLINPPKHTREVREQLQNNKKRGRARGSNREV